MCLAMGNAIRPADRHQRGPGDLQLHAENGQGFNYLYAFASAAGRRGLGNDCSTVGQGLRNSSTWRMIEFGP
jgi:hypothetical protein